MSQEGHFIPSENGPIFALYQPALMEREFIEGVLIVPPAPFEIRRTYRALRNLSQNLSRKGFHSLRFDYRGTGDSYGTSEDWSIENWMADIRSAADHFRDQYGIQRLSIVGSRLGASMALKALENESLKRFVLWDPVFDGNKYFEQLQESHRRLVTRDSDKPPYDRKGRLQCLGYALNEVWINELKAFTFGASPSVRGHLILSEGAVDPSQDIASLKVTTVEDEQFWTDPIRLQMQTYAHPTLALIEKACEGSL